MEITSYDRFVSEDLIHDAYLKLLRCRELSVADPNAYVYVSMRNTYRSQIRREQHQLDIETPSSSEFLEQASFQDPNRTLLTSDRLVEICETACIRSRKTISASLLLLRYFLGYSIEDLSKVANRSRNVIETRLSTFRRDLAQTTGVELPPGGRAPGATVWTGDLTLEKLRRRIFRTPLGRCLSSTQMRRAYRWKSSRPDRDELAHLASCDKCLDAANELLKIETLEQRHPLDVLRSERLIVSILFGILGFAPQLNTALLAVA